MEGQRPFKTTFDFVAEPCNKVTIAVPNPTL